MKVKKILLVASIFTLFSLVMSSNFVPSFHFTSVQAEALNDAAKYPPTHEDLTVLQHSVLTNEMIVDKVKVNPDAQDIRKAVIRDDETDGNLSTSSHGEKLFKVHVFYNDASSQVVKLTVTITPVIVNVTDPKITLEQGQEIDEGTKDKIKNSVSITPSYPEAKIEVTKLPETSQPGQQNATVTVTYPNKDTEEKQVSVTINPKPVNPENGSEVVPTPPAKPAPAPADPNPKKDDETPAEKPKTNTPIEKPETNTPKEKDQDKKEPENKNEAKPKAEPKPLISFKSTSQDLTKEARTTSGKIKVNVDAESAKLVGAKEIEIKAHSYAKTAGFNPLNHELYDISLLDKDGKKITEYKRGFEAEVLLPVRSGREVLAVKHFLDPKDSTKQEKVPSEEVEIAGQKYRKIKVSHFSVYGLEYKAETGKDQVPSTAAAATGSATGAVTLLLTLGSALVIKKKRR